MFLLHDKRKKENLMKFPTFIEVKLNGYMWGGGEKYHPIRKNQTRSMRQDKKWTYLLEIVTDFGPTKCNLRDLTSSQLFLKIHVLGVYFFVNW